MVINPVHFVVDCVVEYEWPTIVDVVDDESIHCRHG